MGTPEKSDLLWQQNEAVSYLFPYLSNGVSWMLRPCNVGKEFSKMGVAKFLDKLESL